ncbi:conserved hypothetical protein [Vibrio nigripulchritudo SOn1]|uniref:ABM domain-containing protein n=1 Tax=Vibrio nigripulchritudo SOn1 TaxID=1238450 RepID=A0AAV2VP36_9VIBR|nr:hypothetical protein [Vibrio nigripulchritudo]CCO46397.1 conserved hypothetical protein [Vibrio nigripulchritudo SOn1]
MSKCTEFAVFQVAKEDLNRAIELSNAIFAEMNEAEVVITSSNVLVKTDKPEEICWHLEWTSAEAAKATTEKWPTFPSTKAFQDMVTKDLYYGHFVNAEAL